MPDLLFELGCEELPAGSVRDALEQLVAGMEARLAEAGFSHSGMATFGTPRRLILAIDGLAEAQTDRVVEARGPGVAAAYDAEGRPTKALEGFCKGQGIPVEEAVTADGYVWAKRKVAGRPTRELLAEALPAAALGIAFKKTMRWGWGKTRFARPVRWILAAFGGEVVPFQIEGVASGLASRGHRFLSPEPFEATSLGALLEGLRARSVEPDPGLRAQRIREGSHAVSNGKALLSDDLVDENAFLTEWPVPTVGEFDPVFLSLPKAVLTTVMAKHEKFFPVATEHGLTNQFVSVRNGGDELVVSQGNAWVLNARFNDARFFYEEDKKRSMVDFLELTRGMSFQEGLGTVRQRADRLSRLAGAVAVWSGANEEEEGWAVTAGLFAKADLTTGLVQELDELQGSIGGEYARREGYPDAVCWAISSQYDLTKNPKPDCPGARTAVRLLIADQLDKLVGFTGLGHAPSGSGDPYALRRAAGLLIQAAWSWPAPLRSYESLVDTAIGLYLEQGSAIDASKATSLTREVFASRYPSLFEERPEWIEAATLAGEGVLDPRGVRFRLATIQRLSDDAAFVQTASRPANIVTAAKKKGIAFETADLSRLDSREGEALLAVVSAQAPLAHQNAQAELSEGLEAALRPLLEPVNAFFDATMVMVEEEQVRNARLKLLQDCARLFRLAGF